MTTPEYEQGRKAFEQGKSSLADNPYHDGITPHREWAKGFVAAAWADRMKDKVKYVESVLRREGILAPDSTQREIGT